ncbi:MAG: ABC-F family ATP-binding cassette domain-containing protein [Lachnospiraceae bacterium]|nr:ABC-F family ATP-binding cassette domain-containing protein [Lachnospiraceae bacterium]
MNLLTINQMTKAHTDKVLFSKTDFSIAEGEKVGVIGINGTGKSTLLKIVAGIDVLDEGELVKGSQVIIQFLPQNPIFQEGVTIYEYVVTRNIRKENEWMIEGEAKSILNKLGFSEYSIKVDNLSGGEKKRVALAAALLSICDILILDEPTNHLDSEMADWLEGYLNRRKGALIMVTHDRYFLDQVCNRIIEIDQGKIYNYSGNYETYLELKAQREEMMVASERKRQSTLRVELEWMKRGARARSTKQKARIDRYVDLKEQNGLMNNENVIMSSVSQRLGKKTLELVNVTKAYGGRVIIKDFNYIFLKNDRIGIVGKNGCGKSTLMKILTGKIQPDSGVVDIGITVKIGYFSQENEYMDTSLKVIDYIKETAEFIQTNEGSITASKMLERFLFDSTLQYQLIEKLSGGEKRRLYLLKILMEAPNVLILDEPTNDLDIETLTILEQYLDNFDGIVITVSHDRYFLDRVVRRVLAFEGEGIITQYEGDFTDYQQATEEKKSELKLEGQGGKTNQENIENSAQKWKEQKQQTKKLKFSYNEQREYETIDEEISRLELTLEQLERNMIQASTDFMKLNEYTNEKELTERLLEQKMERWVYLQDLAEKINN